MFKRKVYNELLEWKEKYSGNYAILLQGARRVGKSTIAEYFAKKNYKSYIKIDFSNISKEILSIFDDISNLDLFFLRLQAATKVELIKRNSVIIFDEIQLAPKVRQAIKHLVIDGRFDYIETGSLISIKKNVKNIVIPSEEMKINVYPMDYEEFCLACGKNYSIYKEIYDLNKPISEGVNRVLMKDFRLYMAVGGMPQAVEAYVKGKSFKEIDIVKKEIIELYKEDFRKIDPKGYLSMLYDFIPSQLALNKNRFIMASALKKRKTTKDLNLLSELIESKTIIPCFNVVDPSSSLSHTKDLSKFKLYLSDIGLFTTMLFNDKEHVCDDIYVKLLSDKLEANLGYLYENAVAQIIFASNHDVLYHTWKNEGDSHNNEVDFLLSSKNKIVAIEVKSSKTSCHKSLDEFSKKYSKKINRKIVLSQNDLKEENYIEYKPVYLLPHILNDLN